MTDYRNRPAVDEPRMTWRDLWQEMGALDFAIVAGVSIAGVAGLYALAVVAGCAG